MNLEGHEHIEAGAALATLAAGDADQAERLLATSSLGRRLGPDEREAVMTAYAIARGEAIELRSSDVVTARRPTMQEVRELALPGNVPVFEVRRTGEPEPLVYRGSVTLYCPVGDDGQP